MLEQLDLERIFRAARHKGYLSCEIYAERCFMALAKLNNKGCQARLDETGGISLQLYNGTNTRSLRTQVQSTDGILQLLGAETTMEFPKPSDSRAEGNFQFKNRTQDLSQLARRLNFENTLKRPAELEYREKVLLFEVASENHPLQKGRQESGDFSANFEFLKKGKPLNYSVKRSRSSIDALWKDLAELPAHTQQYFHRATHTPWPAPQGQLPVLWSSQSLARLCIPFLRAFEGDLVLKSRSFLSEGSFPMEMAFGLEEKGSLKTSGIDQEGSEKKQMTLFDGKRPRGLATDRSVAKELAVESTGHCRRESFNTPATIGFWNPTLIGKTLEPEILKQLKEGLWVQDLELLHFDLSTLQIKLRLKEAGLIHNHELGEWIEPLEWEIFLPELLSTLTHFSDETDTWGFYIPKDHQHLLTELTTPAGYSEAVSIPGSVPKSYYW